MSNHAPKLCIDKIIKSNGNPYESNLNISPINRSKFWNTGQTIQIQFLSGDPIVHDKVKRFSMEWLSYANLEFDFVSKGNTDIRIDFRKEGSWSYIGTDALSIPQNEPTMNYGWLHADAPDKEYYIVLHEFGHALGLIHEMRNLPGRTLWNKEAVYNHFLYAPYYWDKDRVVYEIFRRYTQVHSNFSKYDSTSIMNYHIPQGFFLDNDFIPWNTTLSEMDKEFINTLYPFPKNEKVSSEYNQYKSQDLLDILKERLAKGQINIEEYHELRHTILED